MNQQPWWRDAVIYQVYPKSFADGDGDGIGDLAGALGRLDHLSALGVDAVWFSPFYVSPQADGGYDVADYREVDPMFGGTEAFRRFLDAAHERGMRVIVDLVPNHSSDEHPWFRQALEAAPGSPERARYMFRDGKGERGELPPNNWESVFGGPAWTRVTEADGSPGQWYLHLFDTKQPDFDWENPEVHAEFESILRHWLEFGVDGFRVDVAHGLVKSAGLPDVVSAEEAEGDPEAFVVGDQSHSPMFNRPGVHGIYRAWRRILEEYPGERIMVAEAWVRPVSEIARYVRSDEMHQAFNFEFLTAGWDPARVRAVVDETTDAMDAVGAPPTWVLSNHDVVRHATRFGMEDPTVMPDGVGADDPQPDPGLGARRARAMTALMLALPGSAYLYQGEELGLPDHTALPDDARQDPTFFRTHGQKKGRDGCRVPLPWEAGVPGNGFGPTEATWLPQPPSYDALAADRQAGVPGSTFETYRRALRIRKERGLGHGRIAWVSGEDSPVLDFTNGPVRVVANLSPDPQAVGDREAWPRTLLSSDGGEFTGQLAPGATVWLGS